MTAKATFTKTQIKEAVKEYNSGTPLLVIAANLHTAVETAREVLVAGGAVIRKPGRPSNASREALAKKPSRAKKVPATV